MEYREAILSELRDVYAEYGPRTFVYADSLKAFRRGDDQYLTALNQLLSEDLILGTAGPDSIVTIAVNPKKLAAMTPSVINNVTITLASGARFTGPLAVGQTIAQSYSNATTTQDDKLRNTLQELVVSVARLIEELSDEKKPEVSEDLKVFVDQVKKDANSRSKKLFKVTGDGLIEAARVVANLSEPIASSVRTIFKLLGNE